MDQKVEQYQFLNSLAESRLYRATNQFQPYTQQDMRELLFVYVCVLTMFVQDTYTRDFGKQYASKSISFGKFRNNKISSTDIHQLAYFLSQRNNSLPGKKEKISFNERRLWSYLSELAKGNIQSNYLIRLQFQLAIKNTGLLAVRRLISDWTKLKYRQKQLAVTRLLHTMRARAIRSELYKTLNDFAKQRNYLLPDATNVELDDATKQSTLKRLAVAGATAYAAAELAPRITKGRMSSKTSAGLGAIAGYWASKRKK
jgi:hypothetical protein